MPFKLHTAILALALTGAVASVVKAAETPASGDEKTESVETEPIKLTPEETAEKESRKACKIAICDALHGRAAGGDDIACNVVKSWRKEQLIKLVGKLKVTWPYEGVKCTSAVKLKRGDLTKALAAPKLEMQLDKHSVSCTVNRDNAAATELSFDFSPQVTFENGKATKAKMNWGKITAPIVIKSALWTATAADNTVNMLSGTLVEDVNRFAGARCDEVKSGADSKP